MSDLQKKKIIICIYFYYNQIIKIAPVNDATCSFGLLPPFLKQATTLYNPLDINKYTNFRSLIFEIGFFLYFTQLYIEITKKCTKDLNISREKCTI